MRPSPSFIHGILPCVAIGLLCTGWAAVQAQEESDASLPALSSALERRDVLLSRDMVISIINDSVDDAASHRLSLRDHPEWILFDGASRQFHLDFPALHAYVESIIGPASARGSASSIAGSSPVSIDVRPIAGHTRDTKLLAHLLEGAIEEGQTRVMFPLDVRNPVLQVGTGSGAFVLERLGRGVSDFAGSSFGRSANVRKSLDELNGIVIGAGETFSFNAAMLHTAGWSNALVIKDGGLVEEPGNGICQTVTTAYRAALLAGLPIVERANHSLYVTYYEEYGVGLDATIYPGKQDFRFRNDTTGPIVIVAYAEGDMAVVELYGKPDGRSATVTGPYFSSLKQPESPLPQLKINQIGWKYALRRPDGFVEEREIISTYKAIPRMLHEEYDRFHDIQ